MRIFMHTTAAGPRIPTPLNAGHEYEVEDELARELIESGAAKHVEKPAHHPAGAPSETAAESEEEGEKAAEESPAEREGVFEKLSKSKQAHESKKKK
jgi:hypothetical protein